MQYHHSQDGPPSGSDNNDIHLGQSWRKYHNVHLFAYKCRPIF